MKIIIDKKSKAPNEPKYSKKDSYRMLRPFPLYKLATDLYSDIL